MFFTVSKIRTKRHQGGFSLIELMVTVAIVIVVTGVSLMRYGSFNNSVLLKSQAYEIALDIRQTQLYGVSVTSQTGNFNEPFGIVFTENSNSYMLFQDDGDYVYEPGEEVGERYTIDPRFEILDISTSCGTNALSASVVFDRPNFDAIIRANGGCGAPTSLDIVVASVDDVTVTRVINVSSSGLISVK